MTKSAPITSLRLVVGGTAISLGHGEHVVGRTLDCDVCITDPVASRRHAAITVTADRVTIRDLGSRNGVLVNGEDIDGEHVLTDGDLITLGSQALTVLQICRAARAPVEVAFVTSGPGRHATGTGPAVSAGKHRGALADELIATTTLNRVSPLGRPAATFRLIGEAATRAIEAGEAAKAEKILEAPLLELLAALRAGTSIEDEVIELAVPLALSLCEATREMRWADYLHALHDLLGRPLPFPVLDRLARAMR